jgi:hypothetical protein
MTSKELTENKDVVGEPKVEVLNREYFSSTERAYSKPFDITARDNARIEADKMAIEAGRVEMESIERNKIDADVTFQSV